MPTDDREWTDKQVEVAYRETRAVLDAQRETLADIDETALRTVRITVLLLGVLVSVANLEPGVVAPVPTAIGGGFLVLSIVFGTMTYDRSNVYLGAGEEYVSRMVDGELDDWERDLATTYGGFVSSNADEIDANARLLLVEQVTVVTGVIFVSIGVVI